MLSTSILVLLSIIFLQQVEPADQESTGSADVVSVKVVDPETIDAAIGRSVEILIKRQEGPADSEWPYEGVYRVRGSGPREYIRGGRIIPMGYRVGGTSIAGRALLRTADGETDPALSEALERARTFVVESTGDKSMRHNYAGGYDVRCWGYIYGLRFLLAMKEAGLVPEAELEAHDAAMAFYLQGLGIQEIPGSGGWNYARRGPLDAPSAASPFMTAPALQALFEARAAGLDVDPEWVSRGLKAMKFSRTPEGHIAYAASRPTREDPAMMPGAIGRMVAVETVRSQAGEENDEALRVALAAFFKHWNELEKRRSRNGTHDPPYGVAPYYFFYGHGYAAEAIEELPEAERAAWREKLLDRLFEVREDDEAWNDRVFARSKAYGTSIALMVLTQPEAPPPARWSGPESKVDAAPVTK